MEHSTPPRCELVGGAANRPASAPTSSGRQREAREIKRGGFDLVMSASPPTTRPHTRRAATRPAAETPRVPRPNPRDDAAARPIPPPYRKSTAKRQLFGPSPAAASSGQSSLSLSTARHDGPVTRGRSVVVASSVPTEGGPAHAATAATSTRRDDSERTVDVRSSRPGERVSPLLTPPQSRTAPTPYRSDSSDVCDDEGGGWTDSDDDEPVVPPGGHPVCCNCGERLPAGTEVLKCHDSRRRFFCRTCPSPLRPRR